MDTKELRGLLDAARYFRCTGDGLRCADGHGCECEMAGKIDPLPELQSEAVNALPALLDAADRLAAVEAENAELRDDLAFVERWANHHAAKPSVTPAQALSVIQHYPPISDITRSYADGVIPNTPDPWAELAALKARIAEAPVYVVELVGGPDIHDYMNIDLGFADGNAFRRHQRVRLLPDDAVTNNCDGGREP